MEQIYRGKLAASVAYWRERGHVIDIHDEVDPVHEAAAITAAVQDAGNEVVVFHRVRGSAMPVVTNLYGSRERLGLMLGAGPDSQSNLCQALNRHIDACQAAGRPRGGDADGPDPRQETTLGALPFLTYHEEDAGPYLTTGIILVKDPATGVHNLSFHRGMRVGDHELRISIGPRHDLGAIQREAEQRDEAVEAVFLVGVSPGMFIAGCTSIPKDADEMALAESIDGIPLAGRRAKTVDLMVPDAADIVIEGRILPKVRRKEAPFGEWMGYYIPEKESHVFEVTRVARRPDALFHGLVCGSNEDLRPLELSTAARIFKVLSNQFPGILDVTCHPTMLCTVIQIRQSYEGQARQVLMAAISAHFLYSKLCIVVDEDVDIYRLDDVLWAYVTRARPDQRTLVLGDLPGFFRDPHKDHWGRLALDATIPWGRQDEFRRKTIPGRGQVDLARLLKSRYSSQP